MFGVSELLAAAGVAAVLGGGAGYAVHGGVNDVENLVFIGVLGAGAYWAYKNGALGGL